MYDSHVNFYIVSTSIVYHRYEEMAADGDENIDCPIHHYKIKKHWVSSHVELGADRLSTEQIFFFI
jgi:hypothetical protein